MFQSILMTFLPWIFSHWLKLDLKRADTIDYDIHKCVVISFHLCNRACESFDKLVSVDCI